MPSNEIEHKRIHHVTPRLYLKGFVERVGSPFIWLYSKGKPYHPGTSRRSSNPLHVSIRIAGSEKDYYTFVRPDGTEDSNLYENFLETLEKPADPVFAKIRALSEISKEEKAIFAAYIVQMIKRTPRSRAFVASITPRLMKAFFNDPELIQKVSGVTEEQKQARLRIILEDIMEKPSFRKGVHLQTLPLNQKARVFHAINAMVWCFLIAPKDSRFLTGDNPVFFFFELGLGHPKSELSFPISSNIMLLATVDNRLGTGFKHCTAQYVKQINGRTASNASHYIYFSESAEWVVRFLTKNHYDLKPTE